jgi:hypothetical protein
MLKCTAKYTLNYSVVALRVNIGGVPDVIGAVVIAKLFAVTLDGEFAPAEFKVKRLTPFVAKVMNHLR